MATSLASLWSFFPLPDFYHKGWGLKLELERFERFSLEDRVRHVRSADTFLP